MSKNIKQNQIISITGATATGKSKLALNLATALIEQKQTKKVVLLSVDSRQVYQGLEILTGADIPHGWRLVNGQSYRYLTHPQLNISLHGVSIIPIWQDWSVAHFKKLYLELKSQLQSDEYMILVGGTGFYQRQIEEGAETLFIPQNEKLRQKIAKKSVPFLQDELGKIDAEKLASLNQSDRQNPRRLVSAIEVATFLAKNPLPATAAKKQILKIHLNLTKRQRDEAIERRVNERFKHAIHEVRACLKQFKLSGQLPAATATGFKELVSYLEREISEDEALRRWQISEMQYAKRQDTWWKKVDDLHIFDASDENLLAKALDLVL